MRSIVFLFIIPTFFTISFFVALIALKGKRKRFWLFVWFVVFFGDGFIVSAIFHCYGYLYGKINVYEKPAIRAYYAGEKKFDRWFPVLDDNNDRDYTVDTAFKVLINGNLDYIDYKVKAENSPNNGKYFRVYVDDNTSKECFLSPDRTLRNFSKNVSIPYKEMVKFLNDLQPNNESEDKIAKEIKSLLDDANISETDLKRKATEILRYIKYDVKELQEIYKDKCVARKEISKDEIAPAELIVEDPSHLLEPKPNIKTIFDKMLGMGFNYGGVIKDINTGKILADNIYIYESYHTWILQALVSALGPQSGGEFWMCNKNETNSIKKCNQKMIEEFFRKDRK